MDGVAGFEPAHDDTKNRCLTAWRYPKLFALFQSGWNNNLYLFKL